MTTTPNYGFIIAEGTDTVNLLTQSYPNFTSLDSILKSIELTGITSAVATKAGTVFQVVRTNADLNVLKFVATANYAAGDTFTVDGVSVTATAVDGTALPAGAFVINQTVMALLNGTVLTVLVGGGNVGPIEAEDVDYDNTVSGLTATDVQAAIDEVNASIPVVPASYAASAITYDNTLSGLTAADVQAAIDELASGANIPFTTDGLSIPAPTTSIVAGGYRLNGSLVEVDITVRSTVAISAGTYVVTGLPLPLVRPGDGAVTPAMNNLHVFCVAASTSSSLRTIGGSVSANTNTHFVGSYTWR